MYTMIQNKHIEQNEKIKKKMMKLIWVCVCLCVNLKSMILSNVLFAVDCNYILKNDHFRSTKFLNTTYIQICFFYEFFLFHSILFIFFFSSLLYSNIYCTLFIFLLCWFCVSKFVIGCCYSSCLNIFTFAIK